MASFLIGLTPAHFFALAAIIILTLLVGALCNQRLTRQRWQAIRDELQEQHQLQLTEANAILEHTQLQLDEYRDEVNFFRQRLEQRSAEFGRAQSQADRIPELEDNIKTKEHKIMELQLALSKSNAMQQTLSTTFTANEKALQDKITLLETAENRLTTQFEHLAQKIFEERSANFQRQNATQLDGVLGPLKQQLEGFRQQILDSYNQEQNERNSLKHHLLQLQHLNQKMSQDAINLTKALKGDNKQQGNWGEVILDRVLQESGLREGHEYDTQQNLKDDNGKQFKPDVIVHLPEGKDVVIDAKMSLIAYERYYTATNEIEQAQALRDHILSLRNHIRGLGQKDYQKLHGLKSLDYVLMFIPIEPAFLLALEQDPSLVNFALEHNIMLVSPTNLLVALRTINNIWRYEYQNRNAQLIAKQAGRIYDKLCGYLDDMEKLGRNLDTASRSYQAAMGKLSTGKGNLIRQAHQMKQLGVDSSKQLDNILLESALNESLDDTQVTQ
ncbi:DNA recombination protein RmuC [Shewanella sp. NFH-SH190041]|uniref:DNA recombination protein RmuC n=1 Tax=Shewanella sp. NFH-SH190041 TaxID=2950245 RepID=UPI0021C353DF|nr:DNA recombination protein RmuC [Shewanella sp. NFH-SH190041]BDM64062.1 DNA recombination protein RmuC [Shewanella sp. NFH-SH190041]